MSTAAGYCRWGLVWLLLGVIWLPAGLAQDATDAPRLAVSGTCMGPIRYQVIVAHPPSGLVENQLQDAVQAALDRINQLMSTYVADSDVSRFNRAQDTQWHPVDPETARVVSEAQRISQLSGGAFDITVGPAVNLWKFGPDKGDFEVPDDAQIQAVAARVGYQRLEVRLDPPALRKQVPELEVDLSAIAKGYAVDQVAETLMELDCQHFMVEVGGEVRALGQRPTGSPWRVGVEKPDQPGQVPDVIAQLSGAAMATSGDYRNFQRVGKTRYSHTIDPTTCRPVEHSLASACIVAGDCLTADAWATATVVLGAERALPLLQEQGFEYLLVQRDSDFGRRYDRFMSDRFPLAQEEPEDAASTPNSAPLWPTFLAAVLVFALVIVGMAVGAMLGNKPVQGSCGGLANMTNAEGESSCAICSKPTTDCERLVDKQTSQS